MWYNRFVKYKSKNHSCYSLKYHLILTVKYRKSILNGQFDKFIKQTVFDISKKYDFQIIEQESDRNHLHILIESEPKIAPLQIIRIIKQITTIKSWKGFRKYLKTFFWGEKTLWTDGYFVASVGANTIEQVKRYIHNQGKLHDEI